jgi:uncharacterized membrane protein HdeD (DUF308 family)
MENLKNTLLKKIESKSIEQKPRWRFVLYGIFGIILGGVILTLTLFLVQFLILIIHEYAITHGIGIIESPLGFASNSVFWILSIIGIGLIIGFYRWLQGHTNLYRYTYIYTTIVVAAIIIGSVVGIRLLDQSMRFARIGERPIPGIHQLDRAGRPPRPSGLLSGKIIVVQGDRMSVQTSNRDIFYIRIPPFEQIEQDFEIGDRVTVFGIIHDDQVDAQRIIKQ